MNNDMIAICGLDCVVCPSHTRKRNPCEGCKGSDVNKPKHCINCIMRRCDKHSINGFCYECDSFPCARLKRLDARYREKKSVSPIETLRRLKEEAK